MVLVEDILDYAVLFSEVADADFEREMYAEAKPINELHGADPAVCDSQYVFFDIWHSSQLEIRSIYILLQTATCMKMPEELREAAEVYKHSATLLPSSRLAR